MKRKTALIFFGLIVALTNFGYGSAKNLVYGNPAEIGSIYTQSSDPYLVAHWGFNEGSGEVAYDLSGNSNNGTLYNGPVWTSGIAGGALEFDGVNDYVMVPHSESLNITGQEITFMAWVYSEGFQEYGWIVGKGISGADMVWWVLPRTFGALRYGIVANSWIEPEVPVGLQPNAWYHIAVTYDGSAQRLYVNGVEQYSVVQSGNLRTSETPVFIGWDRWAAGISPSPYYLGKIDEVKVFSRALSDEEILSEYQKTSDPYLVAHWGFNEGSGEVAYDLSGNSNNGTLYNGPVWTSGIAGGALEFDGVNDYVMVPHSESLNITGQEITFMAWVYSEGFQEYGWIVGKGISGDDMVWWVLPRTFGALRYGIVADSWLEREVPVGLQPNTWYHIAVTYDGSAQRLYVNGVEQYSVAQSGNLRMSETPVFIGWDRWAAGISPSPYYLGKIDEVKVFSRAFSDEEILGEYQKSYLSPVLFPFSDITVSEYGTVEIVANAYNPGGLSLTYSINSSLFAQNENVFTWTTGPNSSGEYDFLVSVSVGGMLIDSEPVHVSVRNTCFVYVKLLSCWDCKCPNYYKHPALVLMK